MKEDKVKIKTDKPPKSHSGRIFGHIVNVVIHAIMLYVAVNLLPWEAQFVLPSWADVLGVVRFSLWLNIAAYATFIFYDGRGYYFLLRTAMDAVSIYVAYRLVTVFPFDFDGFYHQAWLNDVFPYLFWLGIVGLVISIIARTVRLAANKNIYY
ncbi:MAG: hypothetical protein PHH01_00770 [Patescibacteria group bacterium]|nr:hypothetical protein [Patescibacteria group bacterium]